MIILSRPVFPTFHYFTHFKTSYVPTDHHQLNLIPLASKNSYFSGIIDLLICKLGTSNSLELHFRSVLGESWFCWVAFATLGVFAVLNYSNLTLFYLDITSLIPRTLQSKRIYSSPAGENYIPRPALEVKLDIIFHLPPNGNYWIVYGSRGVGKTELVKHAAIQIPSVIHSKPRRAVIFIHVKAGQTPQEIFNAVASELSVTMTSFNLKNEELIKQLKKIIKDPETNERIYPKIIFDVERRKGDHVLGNVLKFVKSLAEVSCCIVILSEANAILEIASDPRQQFIFVGELTREEAELFLVKQNCKISSEKRNYVFDQIGTSPIILKTLIQNCPTDEFVNEYVESVLNRAVISLISFPLQTILQALKDHPQAIGIHLKYFKKQIEKGIDLSDYCAVSEVMKARSTNPILFRLELGVYQLASRAHKTALQTYDPIDPIFIPNANAES